MRWWLLWPRALGESEEGRRPFPWSGLACFLAVVCAYVGVFFFVRGICAKGQAREDARQAAYRGCVDSGRSVRDCRSLAGRSP